MKIICFLIGCFWALLCPATAPISFFLLMLKHLRLIFFGVAYVFFYLALTNPTPIQPAQLYNNVDIQGEVASIPKFYEHKTVFDFKLNAINKQPVKALIKLSWYTTKHQLKVGEHWSFQAKLKSPRNYANPGGFDYKRWLWLQNISATGYVKRGMRLKNLNTSYYLLDAVRQWLSRRIEHYLPDSQYLGVIQALSLGIKTNISQHQWQLLRQTGTGHLIAISGLHVGILATVCYFLLFYCLRLIPRLCLILPAQRIAAWGAILSTVIYALLAGFSVPTQRAMLMCSCLLANQLFIIHLNFWQAYRFALLLVMLLNPKSALMPGFYLSFYAVALIVVLNAVNKQRAFFSQLCVMQTGCVLGLMPLSLYFFNQASLMAIVANLLAIPMVGFIIVPLLFISLFIINWPMVSWLYALVSKLLSLLFAFFDLLLTRPLSVNLFSINHVLILISLLMLLIIICYVRKPLFLTLVLIGLIPIFYPQSEKLLTGQAQIDVLDVGQGLAILIQTQKHQLLYDTGTKFYRGRDMAELVINPLLQQKHISTLDKVVISHTDIDHRGGFQTLRMNSMFKALYVSEPEFYKAGESCHLTKAWQWDGVKFEFLALDTSSAKSNDRSCVLKISNNQQSLLLSGDIEQAGESQLVNHYYSKLKADVLIIPHHGSKTSSSLNFLQAVMPNYGLMSTGFKNRYHLPHKKIIQRYDALGIKQYNTAYCGMISWRMSQSPLLNPPTCFRRKDA